MNVLNNYCKISNKRNWPMRKHSITLGMFTATVELLRLMTIEQPSYTCIYMYLETNKADLA